MIIRYILILLFSIFKITLAFSQTYLTGFVYEKIKTDKQVKFLPLPGANVYWKDTQIGVTTNEKGQFKIKKISETNYLVVSFVGYKADTIRIPEEQKDINIVLEAIQTLNEVEVQARQKGEYIDKINPIKTEIITTAGLQKLACCNLSESFENSGTVDVNYTDAVTGAKQIQMLGLAGIYSQLLGENMPLNNYLSYSHGLTFIPGTWMHSIQVSKGTSSVINGFESITGQINVEFKKPHTSDPLFVNTYVNSEGKIEFNTDVNFHINEHLSSGTLIHAESQVMKIDHNNDNFLDIPLNKQINLFQRFNYEKENKYCFQYGIKLLHDDKLGGQKHFNPSLKPELQNAYGVQILNKRYELISKHGFILPRRSTSFGIQVSGTYHEQDVRLGKTRYIANEHFIYSNAIFNTYIFNIDHKIDVGSSYIISDVNQNIDIIGLDTLTHFKNHVSGAYLQYSYSHRKILTSILGFRADYSSWYKKWIYTPKFHVKYEFSENSVLRTSIGKGTRFSLPISENMNYLVSSRVWNILTDNFVEEAWNYGFSFSQKFKISENKSIQLIADYYNTKFNQQVIIDFVTNPHKLQIYSLNGKSYSNSYQLQLNVNLIKSLEITSIGRYNDVRKTYFDSVLRIKPMVVPFKWLNIVSYTTINDKWSFDLTSQWNSSMMLPNMAQNTDASHIPKKSKPFTVIHLQITKRLKNWDLYVGCENLLNFKQHNPIIAFNDPYGVNFDASIIYAPIMGRMYYVGFRYKLKK